MHLFVGNSGLRGGIRRYASRFNMVELSAQPDRLPRMSRLREWRETVPSSFVFSVSVPPTVAALDDGPAIQTAMAYALKVFRALDARWWVLRTHATPSVASKERLRSLVQRLMETSDRVAWEPRGVWEPAQARAMAGSLGVQLVRDLSRDEPVESEVVYSRLRALGRSARLGIGAAERVAQRLAGVREAYIVVEGSGAGRLQQVLREELETAGSDELALRGG